MQIPKGVYHYSERTNDFNSEAAIPQINHPFQASGSLKSRANNLNGFYFPMPFGMDPINLQLITEQRNGIFIISYRFEKQKMLRRILMITNDSCFFNRSV